MATPQEIQNTALNLSMEFGENWLQPIQQRLAQIYPKLTAKELEQYNALSKTVNQKANKYVKDHPVKCAEGVTFVDFDRFENYMLAQYDWIAIENLQRLYSQSCYYAMK